MTGRHRTPRTKLAVLATTVAFAGLAAVAVTTDTSTPATAAPGFTLTGEDTFTNGIDLAKWDIYNGGLDGAGNNRTGADCKVGATSMVLYADANGNCGIAWKQDQVYGKWEVRAKFDVATVPTGAGFDTTFLLWPQNEDLWQNAEIDYVEQTDPNRREVNGFVHCTACSGGQIDVAPNAHPVDMTVWHTYSVEWTPTALTFLIDGTPWFTTSDPKVINATPRHATVQTDSVKGTDGQSRVEIDDVKVYSYGAATPSVSVHGAIGDLWNGGAKTYLGQPVSVEQAAPDSPGLGHTVVQHFQHGDAFWTPTTGAKAVKGANLASFTLYGGTHRLGAPTTNESAAVGGRYNHLSGPDGHGDASIYWSSAHGSRIVRGSIQAKWAAMGWERSRYGFPTSGEVTTLTGSVQHFVGGDLTWNRTTGKVT